MKYNEYVDVIQNEIKEVLNSVNEDDLNRIVDILAKPNIKVLGYSAGRMGLSLRAFIMRLNHLGIHAYWYGDNYIPPMNSNDVFICCSNSGTTKSVANMLDLFKKKSGGTTIAFVGNELSYIGVESDFHVKFKTCNGGINSADDPSKINSIQPMTTLTEQSIIILLDIVALMLAKKLNINIDDSKQFHSNIE